MSQTERAIVEFLKLEASTHSGKQARSALLRAMRAIEAGRHLTRDGSKP
jgi:hypothetical protein